MLQCTLINWPIRFVYSPLRTIRSLLFRSQSRVIPPSIRLSPTVILQCYVAPSSVENIHIFSYTYCPNFVQTLAHVSPDEAALLCKTLPLERARRDPQSAWLGKTLQFRGVLRVVFKNQLQIVAHNVNFRLGKEIEKYYL